MFELKVDLSDFMKVAKKYEKKTKNLPNILHRYVEIAGIRITSISKEKYFGKSQWPNHEHLWVQTGRLRNSIGSKTQDGIWKWKNPLTLEVGTKVVYASIHEFGGIIRWKTKKGQAVIPKRPYLQPAIDDFQKQEMQNVIKRLEKELGDGL